MTDISPPTLPPTLPPTETEMQQREDVARKLDEIVQMVRQQHRNTAVRLAQEAAAGRGPLVDHFEELGRRFGASLLPVPKPQLKLIEGGRAQA